MGNCSPCTDRGCAAGYRDDGCFCWKTAYMAKHSADRRYCDSDEYKDGCCLCYKYCPNGYHSVGCCLCQPNDGPPGSIAVFPHQRWYCTGNQVLEGAFCYDRCPNGYFAATVNICSPNEGAGLKVPSWDRGYCEGEYGEYVDGLCYKKCKTGWSAVGSGAPTECKPDGGIGPKVWLAQRQYCNDNEELINGMCYLRKTVNVPKD